MKTLINASHCQGFSQRQIAELRSQVAHWCQPYEKQPIEKFILLTSEWLTNLAKHAKTLPQEVKLQLYDDANHWQLQIDDDGHGFDDFERAMSVADTEFSELKTSGMGLALIKSMVDGFYYQSHSGVNTLNLVINKPVVNVRRRILLVDDDVSLLMLTEEFLKPEYSVVSFTDPKSALNWLVDHSADLIISDVNMPDMTGGEFRIQVKKSHPTLPFIFLTGENVDQLSLLAIDDVLTKPLTKRVLLEKLNRVFIYHEQLKREIGAQLAPAITRELAPIVHAHPPGYRLYCGYRTADGGGGDFLFQHEMGEQQLILLADVMGHDQQAKFFAHAYQGFLQGLAAGLSASGSIISPDGFLRSFAHSLENVSLLGSSLLTAVAIKTVADSYRLDIASAGHPPPWQLQDGQLKSLQIDTGPLLGFVGGDYSVHQISGTAPVVLYTDGLVENRTDGELKQIKQRIVEQLYRDEPNLTSVLNYYDMTGSVADDITLLALVPECWNRPMC